MGLLFGFAPTPESKGLKRRGEEKKSKKKKQKLKSQKTGHKQLLNICGHVEGGSTLPAR
jgi:hypothetical protein